MFGPHNRDASPRDVAPVYFPLEEKSNPLGHEHQVRATRTYSGLRVGCMRCQCWRDIAEASLPIVANHINAFLAIHLVCSPPVLGMTAR